MRYFNERLVTSPRQRMAVAGREMLRWLAQPHILQTQRAQFETLLLEIAEYAEEWLTSAQSLGLAQRSAEGRILSGRRPVVGVLAAPDGPRPPRARARVPMAAEMGRGDRELELALQRVDQRDRRRRGRVRDGGAGGPARRRDLPARAGWNHSGARPRAQPRRERAPCCRARRRSSTPRSRHGRALGPGLASRPRRPRRSSTAWSPRSPAPAPDRRAAHGARPASGRGAGVPRHGSASLGADAGDEHHVHPSGPRARSADRRCAGVRAPRGATLGARPRGSHPLSDRQRPATARARPTPLRALDRAPARARRARAGARAARAAASVVLAQWRACAGPADGAGLRPLRRPAAGPAERWRKPPFEPDSPRSRCSTAAGASDDKGQLLRARQGDRGVAARRRAGCRSTCTCLIEGEEEIGSPTPAAVPPAATGARSRATPLSISDTRMLGPGGRRSLRAARLALRWSSSVTGLPRTCTRAPSAGPSTTPPGALRHHRRAARRPAAESRSRASTTRVRRLSSPSARNAPPRRAERRRDPARRRRRATRWGERGYYAYERTTIRPALDRQRHHRRLPGPGAKAVIPARALAKLGFRLVPDQQPREIAALLRAHLSRASRRRRCEWRLTRRRGRAAGPDRRSASGDPGGRGAPTSRGFGAAPVLLRSGGTIPVVETSARRSACPPC